MRDVELLTTDPKALFDKLMAIVISGQSLTDTQIIMLEACRNILGIGDGI